MLPFCNLSFKARKSWKVEAALGGSFSASKSVMVSLNCHCNFPGSWVSQGTSHKFINKGFYCRYFILVWNIAPSTSCKCFLQMFKYLISFFQLILHNPWNVQEQYSMNMWTSCKTTMLYFISFILDKDTCRAFGTQHGSCRTGQSWG